MTEGGEAVQQLRLFIDCHTLNSSSSSTTMAMSQVVPLPVVTHDHAQEGQAGQEANGSAG